MFLITWVSLGHADYSDFMFPAWNRTVTLIRQTCSAIALGGLPTVHLYTAATIKFMQYSLCSTRSEVDRFRQHRLDKEPKLQTWLSYCAALNSNLYLYFAGSCSSASRRDPKLVTSAENMNAAERIFSVLLKDMNYDDLIVLWTCLMFSFHLCLAGAFSIRTAKQPSFVTPLLQVAGSLKACTKDCSVFTVTKVNLFRKSCKKFLKCLKNLICQLQCIKSVNFVEFQRQ